MNAEMKTKSTTITTALADDLVWGIPAIAKEINRTERQTFHLVKCKQIPVGKIGGRHVASATVCGRFASLVGEVA